MLSQYKNYFKVLNSFDVEYSPATIKKWVSERTGLQVTLVKQQTPMVYGLFAVATEVEDDSGVPHTLEHLVFLGSKKYPYKGLLDILGNLNFSSTNAYTATDRTVYTLDTAGWEGFNKILPVYLDHIINPTLTDEACYTEVYHVDGEGVDKGVVYSEMEGRATASWSISDLELARTVFHPKSGYSSETGGLLPNLRKLTNGQIQKFHKDLYRAENLSVVVAGSANEEELIETMIKFDSELPSLPETPNPRPFFEFKDPIILKESVVKHVEFPDTDESAGTISIAWNGPEFTDSIGTLASDILFSYLTQDASSLLQKEIVEAEDPLSSYLGYFEYQYKNFYFLLFADGVPMEKIESVNDVIQMLLKEHYEKDQIDLDRIKTTLESSKYDYIFDCEKNPEKLAEEAISDFIYGNPDGSNLNDLKDMKDYAALEKWTKAQWAAHFKKQFIDSPHAAVITKPSAELYKKNHAEDDKRVMERKEKLGASGLAELKAKLQKAEEANGRKIPDKLLQDFGTSDLTKIDFIETKPIITSKPDFHKEENAELHSQIFNDLPKNFPFQIYFDGYKSNFISIKILFSSITIPEDLLPYMLIFQELDSNPIVLDDGTKIDYEEVVEGLKQDVISVSLSSGVRGSFEEVLSLELQIRVEKYDKAIEWIGNLMYNSVFDVKRVKVAIDKFLNSLPDSKREADNMLSYLSNTHLLTKRSLSKAFNILDVEPFYRNLAEQIETEEGAAKIQSDLEAIRDVLFKRSNDNFRIVVVGGLANVKTPVSSWNALADKLAKHSKSVNTNAKLLDIPHAYDMLSPLGANIKKEAYFLGTPGSESSYLYAVSNFDISYLHEDYPAVSLAKSYLQVTEGPLWKTVRGAGLAYHTSITVDVDSREIIVNLYKATDVLGAYKAVGKVVRDFSNGSEKFDPTLINGAISSIVNSHAAADANFLTNSISQYMDIELRKRGLNYKKKLFAKLKDVTIDDLVRVTKKYFLPLFDPETSALFVTLNPNKVAIVDQVKAEGFDVHYSALDIEDSDDEEESASEDESASEEESDQEK